MKRTKRMAEVVPKLPFKPSMKYFEELYVQLGTSIVGIHYQLFMPAIKNLGSDEQRKKWLPDIMAYKLHGSYA